MPVIARFYGLVVKIYFRGEHNPPHFHVLYGEYNGMFDINTLEMIEGDLPSKAQMLIREWAEPNKSELLDMWNTKTFRKLDPLK